MQISWLYLLLAGLAEVGFASLLKATDGFTKLWPTLGFIMFSVLSFWLLTKSLATIPIGTAYSVWTGIGAFGTVIIGIFFFNDPATFWRLFFIVTLVLSIIGIKLTAN